MSPLGIYKTTAKTLDNGHCGEQQRFELTEQNNPTAVCVNKRETLWSTACWKALWTIAAWRAFESAAENKNLRPVLLILSINHPINSFFSWLIDKSRELVSVFRFDNNYYSLRSWVRGDSLNEMVSTYDAAFVSRWEIEELHHKIIRIYSTMYLRDQ